MAMEDNPMFSRSARAGLMVSLSFGLAAPAIAAGCVKGAAVGGVAGHVAGHHAVIGAAAGCAVGHHEAAKKAKAEAANPPS